MHLVLALPNSWRNCVKVCSRAGCWEKKGLGVGMSVSAIRQPDATRRRGGALRSCSSVLALLAVSGIAAMRGGNASAQTLTWDAGSPGGATIENANGDWDTTPPNVWNDAGVAVNFDNGDAVIFAPNSNGSAASVTINLTSDVNVASITFAADPNGNTSFVIVNSDGDSDTIGPSGGSLTITMDDAATINAPMRGALIVAGTQTLTLGFDDTDGDAIVSSLTVNAGASLVISAAGSISGTTTNNGATTNNGTLGDVVNTGTFISTGEIDDLTSTGGSVSLQGIANGDVSITGGTIDLTGALTGVDTFTLGAGIALAVDNDLDVTAFSNSGSVTITSGDTLTVDGGGGTFTNNASGTLNVNSGGTLDGNVVHNGTAAGSLVVGGEITGDVAANQSMTLQDTGTIGGTLTVAAGATATAEGGEIGAVDNQGTFVLTTTNPVDILGDFDNAGVLGSVSAGTAVLTVGGTFSSTGLIVGFGGGLSIQATAPGSLIDLNTGTTLIGSVALVGDIENAVTLVYGPGGNVLFGGATGNTLGGTFTNETGGSLTLNAALLAGGNEIDNDGGTLDINAGGSFSGAVTNQNGGVLNLAAGGSIGGVLTNSADANLSGNVGGIVNTGAGDIDITGSITVSGTISNAADLDINSGTTTVTGLTTNESGGVLTIAAGATLDGNVTNDAGGTLDVNGAIGDGAPAITVTNNGTMTLAGTINGALTNNEVLGIDGASTVTGNLVNTDNLDVDANLSVGGTFTNDTASGNTAIAAGVTMAVTGAVTNQGGADIVIASTGVLSAGGGLTNTGAGSNITLNSGQIFGNVTNTAGATLDAGPGSSTVAGTLTNSATVNVFVGQTLSVTGLTTNQSGGLIVVGSSGVFSGSITNQSGGVVDFLGGGGGYLGTFTNNAGGTVSFTGANGFIGAMNNAGLLEMVAGSSFGGFGTITNTGIIDMGTGASFTSLVSNTASGTIQVNGTASFTGGLNNAGILDLTGAIPATGDGLNIAGGAGLNGTALMGVDLSDGSTASDRIVISGFSSGSLTVDFSIVGTPGTAGSPIIIVDYDEVAGSSLSVTGTNLPAGGGTAYFLSNNLGAGYWEIVTGVNPAVGGIASSATLIQSLIGSVVNRPSSPYVAGLAAAEENPCGAGAWGRATAGVAEASGNVESETTSGGTTTFTNQISANYYGIQLGGDFSCFEGYYNG